MIVSYVFYLLVGVATLSQAASSSVDVLAFQVVRGMIMVHGGILSIARPSAALLRSRRQDSYGKPPKMNVDRCRRASARRRKRSFLVVFMVAYFAEELRVWAVCNNSRRHVTLLEGQCAFLGSVWIFSSKVVLLPQLGEERPTLTFDIVFSQVPTSGSQSS